MTLVAKPAFVGARGIDSVELVTSPDAARRVREAQTDFVLQYLGTVTAAVVQNVTGAGLGFMPVTYADKFDGAAAVRELALLGIPPRVTCWLDVEGVASTDARTLIELIDGWGGLVDGAGYEAGIYVGPGCPLTSLELYHSLKTIKRYWRSGAKIIDRNGQLAEPSCGFCMSQLYPSVTWGGIWSDLDIVQEDFLGRLPTWAASAA